MTTYQNYHKHSYYSNLSTPDSVTSYEDYAKRAVELGHKILSSVEHGNQGRYIECYELAKQYDLKFLFGTEAYFVKDRKEKDGTNAHLVLLARNENGRQWINEILSEANISGFYRHARIDRELLYSIPKNDIWVTSACVAGVWKYESYEELLCEMHQYFGDNFFLEVQSHNTIPQRNINQEIIRLKNKYGMNIIAGVDSHYIFNDKAWERDDFLLSRGISYEDENGWYMDYPDDITLIKRFEEQGILTKSEIEESIENTNRFLDVEEYHNEIFEKNIKMPTIYPDKTQEEKNQIFEDLIWKLWEEQKYEVPKEKWDLYEREIKMEIGVVKDINHADYFLMDYAIVQDGVTHGGWITNTGRGSAVSFFINKLLGFTKVDRISSDVKLYPERFLSKTRILETGSIADIDLNLGNPEVFRESQERIFGENHAKEMIAYGTYKPKSAWKLFAKSQDVPFDVSNAVTRQIEKYEKDLKEADAEERDYINIEDYIDKEYQEIFEKSKNYRGIVSSVSPHPCFTGDMKLLTTEGYKRFDSLCDTEPMIFSVDGKISKSKVWCSGEKEIVSIYLYNSGYIKCTPDHIFMLNDGTECKAKDLKGKRLMPYYELSYIPDKTFEILGFIQGDGGLSKLNNNSYKYAIVYISKKDEEILELLKYDKYNKNRRGNTYYLYGYNDFLRGLKFSFKNLKERIFPLTYDEWTINQKQSFLRGCFSANGCVVSNRRVSYKTICKDFAIKLQETLQKDFNIHSYILREDGKNIQFNNGIYLCSDSYNVCIDSFKGCMLYAQQIGFIHGYKNEALHNLLKERSPKIKCVNHYGIEKVYDFEEPINHWGCVNGYIAHNCASLMYNKNIRRNIGLIKLRSKQGKEEHICALMDGKWAEKYKFLKNDLLKVSVVALIKELYKRIGIKEHTVSELLAECTPDHKVWDVYKNGWTLGINQVEQAGTSARVMKYKPTNISELCSFVAAIRPGFKSMYKKYENREDFAYNIKTIDDLIRTPQFPQSYMLYQEQAMAVLNYAGIPMDLTYAVVKNIAKKREDEVKKYKDTFLDGMKKRIIEQEHKSQQEAEEIAHMTWQIIEDSTRYSFNACISKDTKIKVNKNGKDFVMTVDELYRELDLDYYAYSLFEDNKIRLNKIVDIRYAGYRQTYLIITKNGKKIYATSNHKFPTVFDGVKKLEDLTTEDYLYIMGDELDEYTYNSYIDKIESISLYKEEDVYDVEMEAPNHNFVIDNGIVTCNSHSLSVAIDSLYCAYLKVMYPLEFYETYIKIMTKENKKDKIILAQNEATTAFGIRTAPFKFREDNRGIKANKERNEISSSLATIKRFGKGISEELYGLKDFNGKYFCDLLKELQKTTLKSNQLEILILLDYFEEFGNSKELLEIVDTYNLLKGGEVKQISIENVQKLFLLEILPKFATDKGVNGNQLKSFRVFDGNGLLHACEDYIKSMEVPDFNDSEKVKIKMEYLGYIMPTGKDSDRPKIYINKMYPIYRRDNKKLCGYNFIATSIGSAKQSRYLIWDNVFKKNGSFNEGDIIKLCGFKKNGQSFEVTDYFLLTK